MSCCLIVINLTACNKDLGEIGVDSKTKGRSSNPHLAPVFELAVNKLLGSFYSLSTMYIFCSPNHEGTVIRKRNNSVTEMLEHCVFVSLLMENQVLIGNTFGNSVGTLLHERTVGVGTHSKKCSLLSLLTLTTVIILSRQIDNHMLLLREGSSNLSFLDRSTH